MAALTASMESVKKAATKKVAAKKAGQPGDDGPQAVFGIVQGAAVGAAYQEWFFPPHALGPETCLLSR